MYEPFEVKIGKAKSAVPKWYQSSGMDQRVENLEQIMESLSTGQQELLNCMADMFEKLSTCMDNLANNTAREHGESSRAPSQTVGGRQHSNTGNACLDEDDRDLIMEEDCEDENQLVKTLEISLHAINRVRSAKTMRIQGSLRQVVVYALIDSGSTHNFMSEKLAKKVCLKPQLGGNLRVTVASGEQLESPGAQWLCTLGPILWDFSKLQMKFNANNKEVTLQGLSILDNKVVNLNQIKVVARKGRDGVLLQLFLLENPEMKQPSSNIPTQI
ncbi:hypothetical protein F0562_006458 [Nyssa sinensis]|uniref:Uncharacterized protein n=1 Tax=Nyssa sinensis TaxID=561372 RepID=A0A5J5AL79_9ASTE|nr:hypothetical protein F0562_006458 [Nyssa sinensis]